MPQTSCCISYPAPPTCKETTGDNGRQDHFRAQEADLTNQHPPHIKGDNRRQWETTGDKTTSEPKKPTTPINTHPPHEGRQPETMGDNGRQDHFRAQEADHANQHPPHMKGDNRRQWETTGDKTTSVPDGGHTNQHPPPT